MYKSERKFKLSLFIDDLMLYIENPKMNKETTRAYTDISKVAGYKISTQRPTAILNTNSGQTYHGHIKKSVFTTTF